MQFLVVGHDGTDAEALDRRMSVREDHIERNDKLRDAGHLLFAVAIIDDDGKMTGSSIVYEFENRAALDAWLKEEPYVTGNVWQKIEISNCKVGPSFANRKYS